MVRGRLWIAVKRGRFSAWFSTGARRHRVRLCDPPPRVSASVPREESTTRRPSFAPRYPQAIRPARGVPCGHLPVSA
jgi:hypothetical protein